MVVVACQPFPAGDKHSGGGEIQLCLGPMFSGKTTELIRRCKRYQIANYKCIVVRYARDDRFSIDGVATHDSQTLSAISAMKLSDVKDKLVDSDVIGIDEGQFFPDITEVADELANSGKIVIIAALDGTYQRDGFSNILNLVPKAESVVKLNAVCLRCYGVASYTKRISADKEVEVIGGADKYMAACRKCHSAVSPMKKPPAAQTEMKD